MEKENLCRPKVSAQSDIPESSSTRQDKISGQGSVVIAQPKAQQKTRNFARQIELFDDMNYDPYNEDDDPCGKFRLGGQHFDPLKPESGRSAPKPSPTSTVNGYTGVVLRPGQPTNLMTPSFHNQHNRRAAFASSAREGVEKVLSANSQVAHQKASTKAQKALDLEAFRNTPQSSDDERRTQRLRLNSLDKSKATMPTTSQHQTSNFQELARKQGLREWDNNAIDDRWALRPEETWNTQSQTLSDFMAQRNANDLGAEKNAPQQSSDERAKTFAEKLEQLNTDLKETYVKVQAMQHKDYEAATRSASGDTTVAPPSHHTLAEALAEDDQVILEAPEPRLLRRYIRDLIIGNGTGHLPRGLPYEPDFIRRQFYKVVFGTLEPLPLSFKEEHKLVRHDQKLTTYGQLRKSIFEEIDHAVDLMTRPLSRGPGDSSKTYPSTQDHGEKAPERGSEEGSTTIRGSKNAPFETRPSTASFRDDYQAVAPQESSQLSSKLGEEKEDSSSPEGKSKGKMPSSCNESQQDEKLEFSQTPGCLGEEVKDDSFSKGNGKGETLISRDETQQEDGLASSRALPLAAGQGQHNLATSTHVMYPDTAGATPVQYHHEPAAFPSPANGQYGNSPVPQTWLFQAQQYNLFQAYGGMPPAQPGFATPHYPHPHYGTSHPYSNFYNDRPTRPPASNRLAPLYANSPSFRSQAPGAQPRSESTENGADWQARRVTPPSMLGGNRNSALLPFRSGADDMYPRFSRGQSARFQNLMRSEPLQVDVALHESNVPFGETAKLSKPAEWGVLKISNIPYDITPVSITTFLGNHAKIITPDLGPAVHIIMDRSTGKTQDAFVEFFSMLDAKVWVPMIRSRPPQMNKIGDRILEVELSSQEELLKEIFPRAKSIVWRGGADGKQIVAQESEDPFDSGFKGFITMEEIQSLVRHAEQPHRSIYTQKCPPRPYTGLISVLTKFPWYATDFYTLSTRNILFTATMAMIRHLVGILSHRGSAAAAHASNHHAFHHNAYESVSPPVTGISSRPFQPGSHSFAHYAGQRHTHGLTDSLLRDLVMAGLNAYGFSDKQRWEIHQTAAPILGREMFRLSDMARAWPFETLGRKRGYEEDVIQVYAHLLSSHPTVHQATRSAVLRAPHLVLPFGSLESFYYFLDLNITTLAQMADHERKLLATLITEVCMRQAGPSANPNPNPAREE